MKIDFSDMPILIGTVLFGPVGGMTIAGLKSILYWVTTGASVPGLIGVGSSFISSLVLIWAFYLANRVLSGMKGFKKKHCWSLSQWQSVWQLSCLRLIGVL